MASAALTGIGFVVTASASITGPKLGVDRARAFDVAVAEARDELAHARADEWV